MRDMERIDQRGDERCVDLSGRRRHAHFHGLPGVAHVGFADEGDPRRRDAVPLQRRGGILFQRSVMGGNHRQLDRFLVHHLGDDVVGAPVDGQ